MAAVDHVPDANPFSTFFDQSSPSLARPLWLEVMKMFLGFTLWAHLPLLDPKPLKLLTPSHGLLRHVTHQVSL